MSRPPGGFFAASTAASHNAAMSHDDRRNTPRSITAVRIEPLDGGPMMVAQDISLGGMLVTTRTPRWPGALVPVRFKLPRQARAIRATCRVVELVEVPRGVGLSLRFLKLAPEAQNAIHAFVDQRPLPDYDDLPVSARVDGWVQRIIEDCKALKALAQV